MKRSERGTAVLAALLSGAMLATAAGCATETSVGTGAEEAAARPTYDGQAAFRGIFFGEGPVAKALPEIWGAERTRTVKSMSGASAAELGSRLEQAIVLMKAEGWSEEQIGRAEHALDALRSGGELPDGTADTQATRELIMARLSELDPTFFDRFGVEVQSGDHVRVDRILGEAGTHLRKALQTMPGESTASHSIHARGLYGPVYIAVAAVAVIVIVILLEDPVGGGKSRLGHDELTHQVATHLGPGDND